MGAAIRQYPSDSKCVSMAAIAQQQEKSLFKWFSSAELSAIATKSVRSYLLFSSIFLHHVCCLPSRSYKETHSCTKLINWYLSYVTPFLLLKY
jgi:hypothetical protein